MSEQNPFFKKNLRTITLAVSPLTPAQPAGIGVVSVWGERAGIFMRQIFPGIEPGVVIYRRLRDHDEIVDEVLAMLVRPGRSFTGTEEGEISFHGGSIAQKKMLSFLMEKGARILSVEDYISYSSRFDSIQKDALKGLRHVLCMRQVTFLLRQLQGELSSVISSLLNGKNCEIEEVLRDLLDQGRFGKLLVKGIRILIVGPPNAGKSTLMNRLCSRQRSIVTEIPGTTRDVLESNIEIEGYPVVIVDSGGLGGGEGPLDRISEAKVSKEISRSDMVLCLGIGPGELKVQPADFIRLGPKADLLHGDFKEDVLPVSGLTGMGVPALKKLIIKKLFGSFDFERTALFSERQVATIQHALKNIRNGQYDLGRQLLESLVKGARKI